MVARNRLTPLPRRSPRRLRRVPPLRKGGIAPLRLAAGFYPLTRETWYTPCTWFNLFMMVVTSLWARTSTTRLILV